MYVIFLPNNRMRMRNLKNIQITVIKLIFV
jgi:hypothetical protein